MMMVIRDEYHSRTNEKGGWDGGKGRSGAGIKGVQSDHVNLAQHETFQLCLRHIINSLHRETK